MILQDQEPAACMDYYCAIVVKIRLMEQNPNISKVNTSMQHRNVLD